MTRATNPYRSLDPRILKLIHSEDLWLDTFLLEYDAASSVVHAYELMQGKYVTKAEFGKIQKVLREVYVSARKRTALTGSSHEVLEHILHGKLGALGDKLQLGRSRYNQLVTAIRLYAKQELFTLRDKLHGAIAMLLALAEQYANDPVPGFTHGRASEVSSIGHLFAAYAEALLEEDAMLPSLIAKIDVSPMGTGTAYGSTIVSDREETARLLGFRDIQNNTLAVQLMRGRMEASVIAQLSLISSVLSRLAEDLILFSSPQYAFFDFTDSVMSKDLMIPKKRNPVILEVMRGSASVMSGYLNQVLTLQAGLPAGYQRDLQLTKEPFIRGVRLVDSLMDALPVILGGIIVNTGAAKEAASNPQLFAGDLVASLVLKRDYSLEKAREKISENYDRASFRATLAVSDLPDFNPTRHLSLVTGKGMPGNLNLGHPKGILQKAKATHAPAKEHFITLLNSVWNL